MLHLRVGRYQLGFQKAFRCWTLGYTPALPWSQCKKSSQFILFYFVCSLKNLIFLINSVLPICETRYSLISFAIRKALLAFLTSFWHPLSPLNPGIQHFFCWHKEDSIPCLCSIHHTQLIYQETGAALHVLPTHLRDKQEHLHVQLQPL